MDIRSLDILCIHEWIEREAVMVVISPSVFFRLEIAISLHSTLNRCTAGTNRLYIIFVYNSTCSNSLWATVKCQTTILHSRKLNWEVSTNCTKKNKKTKHLFDRCKWQAYIWLDDPVDDAHIIQYSLCYNVVRSLRVNFSNFRYQSYCNKLHSAVWYL